MLYTFIVLIIGVIAGMFALRFMQKNSAMQGLSYVLPIVFGIAACLLFMVAAVMFYMVLFGGGSVAPFIYTIF